MLALNVSKHEILVESCFFDLNIIYIYNADIIFLNRIPFKFDLFHNNNYHNKRIIVCLLALSKLVSLLPGFTVFTILNSIILNYNTLLAKIFILVLEAL
jgi:hypothetical protein